MGWPDRIVAAFERQAATCARMQAPFTAAVCERALRALPEGPTASTVRDWPGEPIADALALRLVAAFHRRARRDPGSALAACYPPRSESGEALDRALAGAAAAEDAAIAAELAHPPQTNEVGRSACLIGGLWTVAAETQRPLSLLEIGSAAGLNLGCDRYRYDLGAGRAWGPEESPVRIASDWQGAPPAPEPLEIAGRRGCDPRPLDPSDPADRAWAVSFIWPDQPERVARAEAALALAATEGPRVEQADGADWTEARLAEPPEPGTTRVLMHTIMWQYLPRPTQERIAAAIRAAGEQADADAPLAWLRLEPDPDIRHAALDLTVWPGGRPRRLAHCAFHGSRAEWQGEGLD